MQHDAFSRKWHAHIPGDIFMKPKVIIDVIDNYRRYVVTRYLLCQRVRQHNSPIANKIGARREDIVLVFLVQPISLAQLIARGVMATIRMQSPRWSQGFLERERLDIRPNKTPRAIGRRRREGYSPKITGMRVWLDRVLLDSTEL